MKSKLREVYNEGYNRGWIRESFLKWKRGAKKRVKLVTGQRIVTNSDLYRLLCKK